MRIRCAVRLSDLALWVASVALVWAEGSAAQTKSIPDDKGDAAKLQEKVTLSLGTVTVGELAARLSQESGLSVLPKPAIRDRRLTVEIAALTTRQVLDSVAELYDWRWYMQEPGHYVIDRRTFRSPKGRAFIPALMQAALPIDFRAYLRVPDLKKKQPDERTGNAALFRLGSSPHMARERLMASLVDLFAKHDAVSIGELSPLQRDDLVMWLVFGRNDLLSYTVEILHDDAGPHRMTLDRVVLSVQQGSLMIDTTPDVTPGVGFGAQILTADGKPPR